MEVEIIMLSNGCISWLQYYRILKWIWYILTIPFIVSMHNIKYSISLSFSTAYAVTLTACLLLSYMISSMSEFSFQARRPERPLLALDVACQHFNPIGSSIM